MYPVDIRVACELGETGTVHPLIDRKIRKGTDNFIKTTAMTRREAVLAVLAGIELAGELKNKGYQIIATGEMGIGNTDERRGGVRPAGTGSRRCDRKRCRAERFGASSRKSERSREGLNSTKPDPSDGLDVLSKVGGFDLAGLAGVFLGGAIFRIPVVIDGFISAAAYVRCGN